MADTKISAYTAITGANTATGDLFEIVDVSDTSFGAGGTNKSITRDELKKGLAPRGALVRKGTDLTGQNITAALTAIAYANELYDTDACHDNSTNNTRLLVPSGWSWVRVLARLRIGNLTANNLYVNAIYKNGATFNGFPQDIRTSAQTTVDSVITSAPLQVTGGTDYFEHMAQVGVDTSVDILADSWFAIELLA